MATVHQTQPTIQVLLSTADFVAALDLITTTQEVLQQELAGIQSFRFVFILNSKVRSLSVLFCHIVVMQIWNKWYKYRFWQAEKQSTQIICYWPTKN